MKDKEFIIGRLEATVCDDGFDSDYCYRQYETVNTETGAKAIITYSSSVEPTGIDFDVEYNDGDPYPKHIDATTCVEAELEVIESDSGAVCLAEPKDVMETTKEEADALLDILKKDAQAWMSREAQSYFDDEDNWDAFFDAEDCSDPEPPELDYDSWRE